MLSPSEFTVGTFGQAVPLSLILPRTQYEETVIIGHIEKAPVAVFLSGQHAFQYFLATGSNNWRGLIVPNIRVEVDETTVFDPDESRASLGAVIRTDTRIVIRAKSERSSNSSTGITLYDDLSSAGEFQAGFKKWQVVIGNGPEKRVLWQTKEKRETDA